MSAVQPALVAARHRTAGLFHLTMSGLMLSTGGLTGRAEPVPGGHPIRQWL